VIQLDMRKNAICEKVCDTVVGDNVTHGRAVPRVITGS